MAGLSNVKYWLRAHGYADDDEARRADLPAAKAADRTLTESELDPLAAG
jgi:hypothetical protein